MSLPSVMPARAQRFGQAEQFGLLGVQRGDRLAVARSVEQRSRSSDAGRVRIERFAQQIAHPVDIRSRRRLALYRAFAHDVDAQGGVRQVTGDVHVVGTRGKPVFRTGKGMSSTPSMRRIRPSCFSARHGANPTPQLPMTTVVMP